MKVTKMWNILEVLVSSEQSQWRSNNQLCLKSSALCRYVCSHLTVRPNTTSVRWQLQLDLWLISTVILVSPARYVQILFHPR